MPAAAAPATAAAPPTAPGHATAETATAATSTAAAATSAAAHLGSNLSLDLQQLMHAAHRTASAALDEKQSCTDTPNTPHIYT